MVRFSNPQFFYFFILVPLLILFYVNRQRFKKQQFERIGEEKLIAQFTALHSRTKEQLKIYLTVFGIVLILMALVGFEVGTKYEQVKISGVDMVIALDISTSMNAEDIKPSRLEKAKHEITTLLDQLGGDRVALVIFAGQAFVECPMTSDYSAVKMFLDVIESNATTAVGTNFEDALEVSANAFVKDDKSDGDQSTGKALILFSDGEDHNPDSGNMVQNLARRNIKIYAVGVGTPNAVPIPIRDANGTVSFKKNSGSVVTTRLEEAFLNKLAAETGGNYYPASAGESEIKTIYADISKLQKSETSQYQFTEFENRFQWFLLLAVIAFSAEHLLHERKKII
jgi:Ca-activated chloride channel family protein